MEYLSSGTQGNDKVNESIAQIRDADASEFFLSGDDVPHVTLDLNTERGRREVSLKNAARVSLNKAQRLISDYDNGLIDFTHDGNDSFLVVSENTVAAPPEFILLSLMSPVHRGAADPSILYTRNLFQHSEGELESAPGTQAPRVRILYEIRKFSTSLLMKPRDFTELVCWEKDNRSDSYWYASHSITNVPHSSSLARGKIKIMGLRLEPVDVRRRSFLHERVVKGTRVTSILSIDPNVWMPRLGYKSAMKGTIDAFLQGCDRLWNNRSQAHIDEGMVEEEKNEHLFFDGSGAVNAPSLSLSQVMADSNMQREKAFKENPSIVQKVTSTFFKRRQKQPLTELVRVFKEACDLLAPLVQQIYEDNTSEGIHKKKADKTHFTIADGLVQHMLKTYLITAGTFEAVVGEEDSSYVNTLTRPYTVDSLTVPEIYYDEIDFIRRQMLFLSGKLEGVPTYRNCTIFIDPIDGTKPFVDGFGEHCTILIGVAEADEAVAGLIYRPVIADSKILASSEEIRFWVGGCSREGFADGNLDVTRKDSSIMDPPTSDAPGFLTSPRGITKFTEALIEELCMEQIKAGSVGNKVMCLLEGKSACYIQDRGTSRWDICGPQAVIEAYGGHFGKLSSFINENGKVVKYKYRETKEGELNADLDTVLQAGECKFDVRVSFSRFSVADQSLYGEPVTPENVNQLKPYSNICGIICLAPGETDKTKYYVDALSKVAGGNPPSFN
mmetsp:Transcript_1425/g.1668  ORF Transcript_1425/g.1668 Transcript_1425/m.1668 type:complete len:726 (-) Transcript_1425:2476-4653(-)